MRVRTIDHGPLKIRSAPRQPARARRRGREVAAGPPPRLWGSCSLRLAPEGPTAPMLGKALGEPLVGAFAWLQTGSHLEGWLRFPRGVLRVDGTVRRPRRGPEEVHFAAAGEGLPVPVRLAFTGTSDGPRLSGRFVGVLDGVEEPVGGRFDDPGVLCQDAGGPPRKDCGPKIWGPHDIRWALDDGRVVNARLTCYARCTTIEYFDDAGNPLPGSPVTVDTQEDAQLAGGARARVASGPIPGAVIVPGKPAQGGQPEKPEVKQWALGFVLCLKDCTNFKAFQFKNVQTQITGDKRRDYPEGRPAGWSKDPTSGEPMAVVSPPGGWKVVFDGPGKAMTAKALRDALPKDKRQVDASDNEVLGPDGQPKRNPVADGDRYRMIYQFETYVCCDGSLVALYDWFEIAVYTYSAASGWSEPVVGKVGPTRRAPGQGVNKAQVNCG